MCVCGGGGGGGWTSVFSENKSSSYSDFCVQRMKCYLNGLGLLVKKAAMPIYGKQILRKYFFQNAKHGTFKLSIKYWEKCPGKSVVRLSDFPAMTIAVDHGL